MAFPKFCSKCGASLYPGSKFCAKCGNKIIIPEDETVSDDELVKEVAPIEEETPVVEETPVIEEAEETLKEEPQEEVVEEAKEEVSEPVEEVKPEELKVEEPKPIDATRVILSTAALAGYVFGVNQNEPKETKEDKVGDLLEPRKKFVEQLEREHEESTNQLFDELVKTSGVDINLNSETMSEYHKLAKTRDSLINKKAKVSGSKGLAGLGGFLLTISLAGLIILGVFAFTGLTEDFDFLKNNLTSILIGLFVGFGISILLFVIMGIKSKIGNKKYNPKIEEVEQRMKELEEMGYQQLDPLNKTFDFNIMNHLMRKTTPLILLDDHPDMNKIEMLINKYKWNCPGGRYVSTMYMKTGSILGNPFILYRGRNERTVQETYTGSLTITYTRKVTIGKNTTYMPIVQTLTASVTKPRPDFYNDLTLVYGSEAAPNLSFSRQPMIHRYDQKSLTKLFKEREKYIDDYARKHPEFTPLGNDQFEDYFDGVNRDNEVEYRLLFTPLAQQAMLDLITNKEPIGDTFSFRKNKMVNTITLSGHLDLDFEGDPRVFMGFDISEMKKRFINLNKTFFKSMYFHLAPLMAIPLYQQYPSNEYIFKRDQEGAFSTTLCEMLANRFYEQYFAHSACNTPLILKCQEYRVVGNSIQCLIHSYGYHKVAHTEYCPRLGGDGHMHDVPVVWYEYQLVEKTTPFVIHESFINKAQYGLYSQDEDYQKIYRGLNIGQFSFFKGYFTFIKNDDEKYDPTSLNEFLEKKING